MTLSADVNKNSIYLLKIVTTIMILLHHYYCWKEYIGWYIGVEFFFITSGYLLKKKMDSKIGLYDLIEDRIKRLYPTYIVTIMILLIFDVLTDVVLPETVMTRLLIHVPELFMIHMFGDEAISSACDFMNDYDWYVSAMFIATVFYAVIYKRLKNKKVINAFVFIGVVLFYIHNCVYSNSGLDFLGGVRFHNDAIFRAMAAMGIGILLEELSKVKK